MRPHTLFSVHFLLSALIPSRTSMLHALPSSSSSSSVSGVVFAKQQDYATLPMEYIATRAFVVSTRDAVETRRVYICMLLDFPYRGKCHAQRLVFSSRNSLGFGWFVVQLRNSFYYVLSLAIVLNGELYSYINVSWRLVQFALIARCAH